MQKFFVINDINDINEITVRHFSLDKGHFLAQSLLKLNNDVYFLTTKNDYTMNGIKYISFNSITTEFIREMDYVIIIREPLIFYVMSMIPAIKEIIAIPICNRKGPKFVIKSDSPLWFRNKQFIISVTKLFNLNPAVYAVKHWIPDHIDFICAQNEDFARLPPRYGIPRKSIIISNMSITNEHIELDKLINPYDVNHSYCVNNVCGLCDGKALWPFSYMNDIEKRKEINIKKYILVYTGRIKTDNGKILFNMRNIMSLLGEKYELHIFPGSFSIPLNNGQITKHSGKNAHSLELLRNDIFKESSNVIIHHPYEHKNKYQYLYYADCGIDFSDTRPHKVRSMAGHAKILEYCESGLPVVCEENIQNLFLVKNGKNGIIVPPMASDQEYADAIKTIVDMPIDRQYCRNITIENENWDKRAMELIKQLETNK